MKRYIPKDIEPSWQKNWAEDGIYQAVDFSEKPKYVLLTEFPYPSGAGIHIGHTREYTLGDIMARHKRMQGYNVLFPMGYDAFGLPTENYAIKNKISPQQATDDNVSTFQQQLESLGLSIDWSRSFRTSDPNYYKWTQWLFLQFFKNGLAYQDEIAINWCPFEKTGLANEEVVNGRHERCDTPVEKKLLKQWVLRITDYADRLIDGLADLDYPSRIADQQINWIGRSVGAEVTFAVQGQDESIQVFTTRPDTIFGATFMVLAPEHPLVEQITSADQREHVNSYIKAAEAKTDVERQDTGKDKTGVSTGAHAINPATGEPIPIWISDYVLASYGSGAIMAVPAHDERDYAFATKFNLPIKPVVAPTFNDYEATATDRPSVIIIATDAKTGDYCVLNWGNETSRNEKGVWWPGGGVDDGETLEQAAIREFREETGYGDVTVDEVLPVATATYWYHDERAEHKRSVRHLVLATVHSLERSDQIGSEEYEKNAYEVQWLTAKQLKEVMAEEPLTQAELALQTKVFTGKDGVLIYSGKYNNLTTEAAREKIVADLEAQGLAKQRINYRLRDWIFSRQHYWGEPIPIIHCPQHGAVAVPDDQLPVTLPPVEHYEPTDTGESPLSQIEDWVNTTCPQCGRPAKRETDTMPNWAGSSWYYLRYFDAHNDQAFAAPDKLDYWQNVDLYLGGMEHTTLHLLYSRFWHEFFYDQGLVPTPEPYQARRGQGIILAADGTKMSKSKGNVVNPSDVINQGYGADALRVAIAFLAPYDQTTPWSPEGVAGTHRFLSRIWTLTHEFLDKEQTDNIQQTAPDKSWYVAANRTIKKVSDDLESMSFNTAIAALMEYVNELYKFKVQSSFGAGEWRLALSNLLRLLAPFAPHMAEELWQELGNDGSIHTADWPTWNDDYLVADTVTIVVQVNGKLRGDFEAAPDISEADAIDRAKALDRVQPQLDGKVIVKAIYVPGKLVNLVVK